MKVSINKDQGLFHLDHGGFFTCFGIDNCDRTTRQLARLLGDTSPIPAKGTIDQYLHYQALVDQARDHDLGTWFSPGTPEAVKLVLDGSRRSGRRIRLFYGDTQTGRDWLEENDVCGRVGRSMGPLKSPIILANKRSKYGPAILTDCIVRIMDTGTGQELYRHPNYVMPRFESVDGDFQGLRYEVHTNGSVHARFKTPEKRHRWIKFMRGEGFRK